MTKKIISIILSLVMIFSIVLPVSAKSSAPGIIGDFVDEIKTNVETTKTSIKRIVELSKQASDKLQPVIMDFVLDTDNWEMAADYVLKLFVGSQYYPELPVAMAEESEEADSVAELLDVVKVFSENMSIGEFTKFIQKYCFISYSDIDEKSKDILEYAEFKYDLTEDGKTTVFIMVDIERNPELLNITLVRETVKKLYEKQNAEYSEGADILMGYEYLAGELALHALLYAVTNEYLAITGKTEGFIYNLWVRSKDAQLNIDENRIPIEFIQIVGILIMSFFVVDFYSIYTRIFKR